jgi:tetratricopeptide (TPR) repeat protein
MDSDPHAQSYKEFLGVIFLPTIAIVNHTGYIRFKADRVLSKEDLLSVAKKAQNPNTHIYSMATGVESDPLSNYGQTILHVIGDDNSKLPPDLIRQEAYFRLELMDGSHIAAAQQYLATQSDWSAESNLRFILDFVSNVSSKEWEYLLTHRKEFDTVIGKDQVDRTIQIIVYNQLYQGYPRPTLEEAINYYSLIDAVKCTQWGHIYILNRYLDECQSQNYIEVANYYLSKLNTNDHYVMYNLANFLYQDNLNEKAGVWIDEAVKLKPDDIDYLILAAEIYSLTPQKEKSIKYIDKALELSQKENRNQDYLIFLKNNIIGQKSNK